MLPVCLCVQVVFRSDLSLRDFRCDLLGDLRLRRRHHRGAREEHSLRTGKYSYKLRVSSVSLLHCRVWNWTLSLLPEVTVANHTIQRKETKKAEILRFKDEAGAAHSSQIPDSVLYNYVDIMETHCRPCDHCNCTLCVCTMEVLFAVSCYYGDLQWTTVTGSASRNRLFELSLCFMWLCRDSYIILCKICWHTHCQSTCVVY